MVVPEPVPAVVADSPPPPAGDEAVDWITSSTRPGRTVTAAVPPVYAGYATVVVPDGDDAKTLADSALVEIRQAHTPEQPRWLGYLDTGVADLVEHDAPRVAVFSGWPHVLLAGGPGRALSARRNRDSTPWHSALLLPRDRSWVVATLWDDDWRCIGGPSALVQDVLDHPGLQSRTVAPGEDAAPPGPPPRSGRPDRDDRAPAGRTVGAPLRTTAPPVRARGDRAAARRPLGSAALPVRHRCLDRPRHVRQGCRRVAGPPRGGTRPTAPSCLPAR